MKSSYPGLLKALICVICLGAPAKALLGADIIVFEREAGGPALSVLGKPTANNIYCPDDIETANVLRWIGDSRIAPNEHMVISHSSKGLLGGKVGLGHPDAPAIERALLEGARDLNLWMTCNIISEFGPPVNWVEHISSLTPGKIHVALEGGFFAVPYVNQSRLGKDVVPMLTDWLDDPDRMLGAVAMLNGRQDRHLFAYRDGQVIWRGPVPIEGQRGILLPDNTKIFEHVLFINPKSAHKEHLMIKRSDGVTRVPLWRHGGLLGPEAPLAAAAAVVAAPSPGILTNPVVKAPRYRMPMIPVSRLAGPAYDFILGNISEDFREQHPDTYFAQAINRVEAAVEWGDNQVGNIPSQTMMRGGGLVSDLVTLAAEGQDGLVRHNLLEMDVARSSIPVMRAAPPWYRQNALQWSRSTWKYLSGHFRRTITIRR